MNVFQSAWQRTSRQAGYQGDAAGASLHCREQLTQVAQKGTPGGKDTGIRAVTDHL